MLGHLPVAFVRIHSLSIPLRDTFRHAAAQRKCAEPILVAVELADHTIGYGETHARPYVTGESREDVIRSIRQTFVPILLEIRPRNFGEAIEAAANLPLTDDRGRIVTAARAAVELALLDAYSLAFRRSLESIAGYLEETWLGAPGSSETARFSVVLSGMDPHRVRSLIRKVRLAGIRHFKLKVGDAEDQRRLDVTIKALRRGLEHGSVTLRLDANGAWNLETASAKLRDWEHLPITCVEQPLPKDVRTDWPVLARRTSLPLMADESLVTPDDAEDLIVRRGATWFNIRISKNGGLIPAMRLAITAHRHNIAYQLGCMVGETSILSAAGRWFLQMVPNVPFAEGSFGKFLLTDDVTRKSLRFSFGGGWAPITGFGLGVVIDDDKLLSLACEPVIELPL